MMKALRNRWLRPILAFAGWRNRQQKNEMCSRKIHTIGQKLWLIPNLAPQLEQVSFSRLFKCFIIIEPWLKSISSIARPRASEKRQHRHHVAQFCIIARHPNASNKTPYERLSFLESAVIEYATQILCIAYDTFQIGKFNLPV